MSELPLEPQLAACLIDSHKYNCCAEILSIVALLSSPNIFLRPREKAKQADEAKAFGLVDEVFDKRPTAAESESDK